MIIAPSKRQYGACAKRPVTINPVLSKEVTVMFMKTIIWCPNIVGRRGGQRPDPVLVTISALDYTTIPVYDAKSFSWADKYRNNVFMIFIYLEVGVTSLEFLLNLQLTVAKLFKNKVCA